MKTIWKYTLRLIDGSQPFHIPSGGNVLTVGLQNEQLTLWIEVDTEAPKKQRSFQVFGTGHPIETGIKFIGTAIGIHFVWHVYEDTFDNI